MQLEFAGAAQNVTGSKHILRVNGKTILLDCGMFQWHRKEADEANKYLPFKVDEIDAVVLSHAHIDHSGLLPLLVKKGYEWPIYCTHATRDLCSIMLQDSANIQKAESKYLKQRKWINAEPLYSVDDANQALTQFRSVWYDKKIAIDRDIFFTFKEAGHILGSASELWEIYDRDTDQHIRLGFTGDLGRKHLPILRAPEQLKNLDVLITESTYGGRFHQEIEDVESHLIKVITETVNKNGKIMIPAFAVERTQEIIFVLKKLMHDGKIMKLPIYVDSPLATDATSIFRIHPDLFDEELSQLRQEGIFPFLAGDGTTFTRSSDESKRLNQINYPCIIIAASGMCEFWRIVHHIKNNIWDPNNLLLVIGFMAEHTLGRQLVDGKKKVNIHGSPVEVRARVEIFNAFSGHADHAGLVQFARWCGDPRNVFMVHGEMEAQEKLKDEMKTLTNLQNTTISNPSPGEIWDLHEDKKWRKSPHKNARCEGIVCRI